MILFSCCSLTLSSQISTKKFCKKIQFAGADSTFTVKMNGRLPFIGRSRLNSRFNINRDVGLMLTHKHKLTGDFILIEKIVFSQGKGRNITAGNFGANEYTFKLEALPFGTFQSKGDYVASVIKKESTPKLSIGLTYDINNQAARERGNLGSFIDADGTPGKTLNTFFADLMFKYQGFSAIIEYTDKSSEEDDPILLSNITGDIIGEYYNGSSLNIQAGYMFKNNYEIDAMVTSTNPDVGVDNDDNRYTFGLSKFFVGHGLKTQTDITYISLTS